MAPSKATPAQSLIPPEFSSLSPPKGIFPHTQAPPPFPAEQAGSDPVPCPKPAPTPALFPLRGFFLRFPLSAPGAGRGCSPRRIINSASFIPRHCRGIGSVGKGISPRLWSKSHKNLAGGRWPRVFNPGSSWGLFLSPPGWRERGKHPLDPSGRWRNLEVPEGR